MKKLLYKVKKEGEVFTGTIVNIEGSTREERDTFEKNYLENLLRTKGKTYILKHKD